jgi:hypothetical protein
VRFHDDPQASATGLRGVALTLPGLPAPQVTCVDLSEGGEGFAVEQEVRRGVVPEPPAFAMVSVARRNPTLTRAEFVDAWRNEAGRLGAEVIPDDVRGVAYVQLHPIDPDPPYDAVNMVWFADVAGLRRRAEWFAERPVPDLFRESWSLYVRVASSA